MISLKRDILYEIFENIKKPSSRVSSKLSHNSEIIGWKWTFFNSNNSKYFKENTKNKRALLTSVIPKKRSTFRRSPRPWINLTSDMYWILIQSNWICSIPQYKISDIAYFCLNHKIKNKRYSTGSLVWQYCRCGRNCQHSRRESNMRHPVHSNLIWKERVNKCRKKEPV